MSSYDEQRCNLTLARLPQASEYHDGQVVPLFYTPYLKGTLVTIV
jgi:hypothetical protein